MPRDRLDRAHGQHRAQREADIGGVEIVHHRRRQDERQPLPPMLHGSGEAHPAPFDEAGPSLPESGRHSDPAIVPARSDRVTGPKQWRKLAFRQGGRTLQYRINHFGVGASVEFADLCDGIERQPLLRDGCGVTHVGPLMMLPPRYSGRAMGGTTKVLQLSDEAIAEAARLVLAGEPVAVPTETVYGLAADATNAEAVARIYAAKGRPSFNPLIVHVPDL